jgi:hypothetical protein
VDGLFLRKAVRPSNSSVISFASKGTLNRLPQSLIPEESRTIFHNSLNLGKAPEFISVYERTPILCLASSLGIAQVRSDFSRTPLTPLSSATQGILSLETPLGSIFGSFVEVRICLFTPWGQISFPRKFANTSSQALHPGLSHPVSASQQAPLFPPKFYQISQIPQTSFFSSTVSSHLSLNIRPD